MHQRVIDTKNNNRHTWENLRSLHDHLVGVYDNVSAVFHNLIQSVLENPSIYNQIKNPQEFLSNVEILSKDIESRYNTLDAIRSKYQDKCGLVKDHDENMSYLTIAQDYTAMVEAFETVLAPTQAAIVETYETAKAKAEHLSPEQDPNVITDVVVN